MALDEIVSGEKGEGVSLIDTPADISTSDLGPALEATELRAPLSTAINQQSERRSWWWSL
jgi:hypothetical protein